MKRRTIHGCFAVLCAGCLAVTAVQAAKLWKAVSVNRAVAAITTDSDKPNHPRAQIVWAVQESGADKFESAESVYTDLIRRHGAGEIGQVASFNLANAYLREGIRNDTDLAYAGPMLELAKQRYRDLLKAVPGHWDARFNLERALRLAPEMSDLETDDRGEPIKRVNVVVPDFKAKDLP